MCLFYVRAAAAAFRSRRYALLAGWVVVVWTSSLALSTPAEAEIAQIQTTGGDIYAGELVRQTSAVVVINVGGIDASFAQSDIVEFKIVDTPEQVYKEQRRALTDDDLIGRLELARRMVDLRALEIAEQELTSLNRDFPDTPAVLDELSLLQARMKLNNSSRPRVFATDAEPRQTRDRMGATDAQPFLTPEQINLLKVYEIDLGSKPRVSIPSETIDSFFQKYSDHRDVPRGRKDRSDFKRLPGYEQLDLFFRVQARDFYDQVEVRQEPEPLAKFRRIVNPNYLARYFAPMFGQGQIEGLHLFNQRPEEEDEAYTNFYLLSEFTYDDKPMLDRLNPEQSLLLQWGLAREAARFPAPEMDDWRPLFKTMDDPDFRRYAEWIGSLFTPSPDYGIEYPPPADARK